MASEIPPRRTRVDPAVIARLRRDQLTGLLAFGGPGVEALITGLLADSADPRDGAGVIEIDIRKMKCISDALTHPVADRVLVAVGEEFARRLGPFAAVGRRGGDEFLAVVPVRVDRTGTPCGVDDRGNTVPWRDLVARARETYVLVMPPEVDRRGRMRARWRLGMDRTRNPAVMDPDGRMGIDVRVGAAWTVGPTVDARSLLHRALEDLWGQTGDSGRQA